MKLSEVSNGRVMPKDIWDSKEEYLLYLQHFSRYNFAKSYVKGKSVLELGCGTGYGTNFLSPHASSITGSDVSKEAIQYCKSKYKRENLNFIQINEKKLPFGDSSYDICISFEVIEHIKLKKVKEWLSEINRILKNDGIFICSTPNKKLRLLPLQKPCNPHHMHEYSYKEFRDILESVSSNVKIFGLRGTKETQAIEEKRVKQNPLKVYIICPLSQYIPSFVKTQIIPVMKSKQQKNNNSFVEIEKYSINDFIIDQNCLDRCLNFVGIATKSVQKN